MTTISSPKRRNSPASRTATLVGISGLALAVFGPLLRDAWDQRTEASTSHIGSAPTEVRGARLDSMGSSSAQEHAVPSGNPNKARADIPEASFEMAAQLDAVATRKDGALTFEHTNDGKYLRVPMSALSSFRYDPKPHPQGAAALGIPAPSTDIPPELLALDGRAATVVGFMVPLQVDERGVSEFVLSQNRSFCCYGVTPALNEMILVRMKEGLRAPYTNDTPIATEIPATSKLTAPACRHADESGCPRHRPAPSEGPPRPARKCPQPSARRLPAPASDRAS